MCIRGRVSSRTRADGRSGPWEVNVSWPSRKHREPLTANNMPKRANLPFAEGPPPRLLWCRPPPTTTSPLVYNFSWHRPHVPDAAHPSGRRRDAARVHYTRPGDGHVCAARAHRRRTVRDRMSAASRADTISRVPSRPSKNWKKKNITHSKTKNKRPRIMGLSRVLLYARSQVTCIYYRSVSVCLGRGAKRISRGGVVLNAIEVHTTTIIILLYCCCF